MSRHFPQRYPALCASLVLMVLAGVPGQAQSPQRQPEAFLRKYIHLSDSELTAMQRGEVVAKLVDTTNKRELAVRSPGPGGAALAQASRSLFLSEVLMHVTRGGRARF